MEYFWLNSGMNPTRNISIVSVLSLNMYLLGTLMTCHILTVRWPSTRSNIIPTASDLKINFLQRLVYWLINCHSVWILWIIIFLILLLSRSRFLPLGINKVAVFICNLLHEGLIGDYLLRLYKIKIAQTKFLDKSVTSFYFWISQIKNLEP